jgi:hypothetical protein
MKAELKQKWIDALRSGVYQQTQGQITRRPNEFRADVAYCCLGVLLCVSGKHRVIQPGCNDDYDFLDAEIGAVNRHTLVEMNDMRGKTFAEIADYVEAKL